MFGFHSCPKKDHKSALTAASKAIEFDPKHVKSYFRRGSAHEHLGEKREALLGLVCIVACG